MICFFYNQNVDLLKLSPIKQPLREVKKVIALSEARKKNVIVVHINPKLSPKMILKQNITEEDLYIHELLRTVGSVKFA